MTNQMKKMRKVENEKSFSYRTRLKCLKYILDYRFFIKQMYISVYLKTVLSFSNAFVSTGHLS